MKFFTSQNQAVGLHHFSDTSITGYGECIYFRAVNTNGNVHCSPVMGKVCVAPTKVTTVPQLELSVAAVAARMGAVLKNELEIDGLQEYFWTYSKSSVGIKTMMPDVSMCCWQTELKKSSLLQILSNGTLYIPKIILQTMLQKA